MGQSTEMSPLVSLLFWAFLNPLTFLWKFFYSSYIILTVGHVGGPVAAMPPFNVLSFGYGQNEGELSPTGLYSASHRPEREGEVSGEAENHSLCRCLRNSEEHGQV